jgi:hypothetical protein
MTSNTTGTPVSDADYIQLQRLANEVNHRIDAEVAASVHELFTEDGTLATFGEPASGTEALRAWGRMMDTDKPLNGVRHVLSNFRFVEDGPDRAVGTVYITAFLPGAAEGLATLPFAMGVCTDEYQRIAQAWKVKSRTFAPHFMR